MNPQMDLRTEQSAGEVLAQIGHDSRDETEKGRWFEKLASQVLKQQPEFEIEEYGTGANGPSAKPSPGSADKTSGLTSSQNAGTSRRRVVDADSSNARSAGTQRTPM